LKKIFLMIYIRYLLLLLASFLFTTCNKNDSDYTPPEATWPIWIFSHWIWEGEGTTASAKQLADDYLAHDIPVGAIVIDSPWETGYNSLEWDESRYPDAQGMIDYFHSKDIRCLLWITSAINLDSPEMYDYYKDNNYLMKESADGEAAVFEWWKGEGSLVDFWNPEALTFWKSGMDRLLDMGIDGWKTDGTDYFSIFTPYSPGKGKNMTREEYSAAYYRLFYDYTREKLGNDRTIMSRPVDNYGFNFLNGDIVAFAPTDIPAASWVGDQDASFTGMVAALNNMYYSSQLGYLFCGSDIGGYRTDDNFPVEGRSKELFIRWAQLGAFCPLMENGGGGEHRPWMFDEQTTDIYRNLVITHNKMAAYLNQTARYYFDVKKSLMQFQRKSDYSYLLGPDIFVTPIRRSGSDPLYIKFPEGNDTWLYLYDPSKEYSGGVSVTLDFSIEEYPVFVKKGSAIADSLLM